VKNPHSEQHLYNCSSDYMVLIHHTAPDRHVKRYNYKGRQYLCQSHNLATHAQPFGLPCSEAMSVHTRLTNFNLCVLHGTYMACTHAVCDFNMAPNRHVRLHG
jgi:hypothetical protein